MPHRYLSSLVNIGATAIVVAIIGLSFFTLSPQFDPHLNSDHAVHVLMTYDLQLPEDLYYWGQNRLGSLVPIMAHYGMKVIPLSPVQVLGLVNYGTLLVSYLCFTRFFRHALSRILLAIAFFLPLKLYIEIIQIGQPYGGQFACLGLASMGLKWLLNQWSTASLIRRRTVLGLTMGTMTASLWMSDFSIVYWGIGLGAIAYYLFRTLSPRERRMAYPWAFLDTVTIGIMGVLSLSFLRLAKHSAHQSGAYTKFNTLEEFVDLVTRMGQSIWKNLQFQGEDIWVSIFAITSIIVAGLVIYSVARYGKTLRNLDRSIWLGAWGLCSGCSLLVLLSSNWVYNPDHIPQRYFSVVYLLAWFTVLLIREASPKAMQRCLSIGLIVLAIASGMSLLPRMLDPNPPRVVQLEALKSLAPAAFIGNYWQSYVLCMANPELFACTPYDRDGEVGCPKGNGQPYQAKIPVGSTIRCKRCVEKVLESASIYFVKGKWFEKFPKRIEQFGYCFQRSGPATKVGQYTLRPYRRLE
ncbi:MAG: hypothetical protein AAGD25_18160 [Cyanobacteria bacterium P01_F01_bin.150]